MQTLRDSDPRWIGPYAVLGRLGAGGMGEVYLAESGTGLRLAVKVVRAEHAEDRTFRARFRQEVRAAQTVGGGAGTYTARVVDADTDGERPWMATEFVDGPNLRDAVLDHGPLPVDAVRLLAAALGEALTEIHARGMVHRDLKPSNILLAPDGPRVIDFGIVRALEATALTRTGAVVGSVGYVSPEQIRNNGRVGPPSDVFALGAVLAYAAAGREPFGEGKDAIVLMRILNGDFDLSAVPEDIRWLIEPCLSHEPGERPAPAEVAEAVGHTPESLRESLRPGWYTAAGPEPDAARNSERWLPERDSGEGESRVEYIAPVTVTDVTPEPPSRRRLFGGRMAGVSSAHPVPSRRRLLRGIAAGALVAAGAGTGGWLWLRDGEGDGDGGGGDASVPVVEPAVVDWDHDTGGIGGKHGPCAAVSPDGGQVYVGGADGSLHALTPDGTRLWATGLGGPVLFPLATADGAYCVVGGSVSGLCAVDLTGRERWRLALGDTFGEFPVAAGELILVSSRRAVDEGTVRAYRPDGTVAWETVVSGMPTSEPLVADGVVYVGTDAGLLAAMNADDGSPLWTVRAGTACGRPALADGSLVVGADGDSHLYGISVTGKRRWDGYGGIGSVGRTTGFRTIFTAFGDLAVTTSEGLVVAVDPDDGSTAWTFRGDDDRQTFADPTVHGDHLYVCISGTLYVVDREGKRQRAVRVPGTTVATTAGPVVAARGSVEGERVYVGTRRGVAALDMSA
ncbi:serine/threonine-protein kinase [Streptomyces sp. S.PB5]|uniref:serine/threonine-protein kinase n=1 Tax=Streptomyces sp. S.PB5 TaxID=3020844 RepID=UPI0025B0F3CC|nr:serine/threonine-protein kinase [Streptomyces sp. S.PB5]MDN3024553.1 serine/threonine-protein kinase [Streptomyces sp. S.PB5]